MPHTHLRIAALLAAGLLALPAAGAAQDMPAPVNIHVPLLLKILAFDRALAERAPREVVVGVVFQSRFRLSARAADEVREALGARGTTIGGVAVRVVPVDLDAGASLDSLLDRTGLHVLYVAPLRAVEVTALAGSATGRRITTMTGVPGYVDQGLVMGIDVRGDRPQIVVNLAAARASGAAFSSQLLKMARLTTDAGRAR